MRTQLDDLLDKKNMTAKQVAKDTGVDPSQVSRWRTGKQKPNARNLLILAEYFEVSADELLRAIYNMSPSETQ